MISIFFLTVLSASKKFFIHQYTLKRQSINTCAKPRVLSPAQQKDDNSKKNPVISGWNLFDTLTNTVCSDFFLNLIQLSHGSVT